MTFVELGLEHWHTGKRSRKYYTKQYDISDSLWNALNKFANENELCRIGKYEYDKGKLYMFRLRELDDVFRENSNTAHDYKMFEAVQTEIFGGNIEIKEMDFKYEYTKKVISVDMSNRICTVEKKPSKKELDDYILKHHTAPPIKTYSVAISDMCIHQNIKENDIVLIRKFLNNQTVAIRVIESFEESVIEKEELEKRKQSFEDLLGDY